VERAADNLIGILNEEGMSPSKVSFDHSDDSGDLDYFLGLVRHGYCLGLDHVHRGLKPDVKPSFERRAECIARLIGAGFAENIFISQDVEFGGGLLSEEAKDFRSKLDPPEGMLFSGEKLIPSLQRMGVTTQAIRTITVENPKRFFGSPRKG
jgi:predicted metal-dependent phosphotriesterase family hydrolase